MESKYIEIYCDGGVYPERNIVTWGYLIVENGIEIHSENGWMNGSGGFDVERAESEAIFNACKYAKDSSSNFRVYSDSKSVIDKVRDFVPNATKNKRIKQIRNFIKESKYSPYPGSIQLEWKRRCSDKYMEKIHEMCELLSKVDFKGI